MPPKQRFLRFDRQDFDIDIRHGPLCPRGIVDGNVTLAKMESHPAEREGLLAVGGFAKLV